MSEKTLETGDYRHNKDLIEKIFQSLLRGIIITNSNVVIPAEAGIQTAFPRKQESRKKRMYWIPHQVRNDRLVDNIFKHRYLLAFLRYSSFFVSIVLGLLFTSVPMEASDKNIPQRMVGYSQVGSWTRDEWDYKKFLDMLSEFRLNYTRIFGIVPWYGGLMPWVKGEDGRSDLTRFESRYWVRLNDYVKYANSKGIIVHFTLFDRCGMTDDDGWPRHPFNSTNNINGIEAKRGWHRFTSEQFREAQKDYVIRAARELKDLNVIFEVANEPMDGPDWHRWVIEIMKAEGLRDEAISINIHTSDLHNFVSSALWVSFHIKGLPQSIQGGNFIYSDDGVELRDPDTLYKWSKAVLDKGGSYEHLSAANDVKGSMPPVEILTILMKARYGKDKE
jgi:hypothetical protein